MTELELRMKLKFLRDELRRIEVEPYLARLKERRANRYEKLMEEIAMECYLADVGDR